MSDLINLGDYHNPASTPAELEEQKREENDPYYFLPATPADYEAVLSFLLQQKRGVYSADIAIALHRSLPTMDNLLQRMKDLGLVRFLGLGLWALPLGNVPLPKVNYPKITEKTQAKCDRTPEKTPSKRKRGEGSGYIQARLSQGKYKQYFFCWEEGKGDSRKKRSKYLNKAKLMIVRQMNQEKKPLEAILKALGVKTA